MTFRMAARVDKNQPQIVKTFRDLGCTVLILSQLKTGLDVLVGKHKINVLVEIKDGEKVPSARKLTKDEKKFIDSWKGWAEVVESVDDAIALVRKLDASWQK
jgi:hypothetical protein